jgi:hypothetical protein
VEINRLQHKILVIGGPSGWKTMIDLEAECYSSEILGTEVTRKTGKISFNPIHRFKTLKVESGTRGRLSPEQVARLLAAYGKDEDWRGAILCAYSTGDAPAGHSQPAMAEH